MEHVKSFDQYSYQINEEFLGINLKNTVKNELDKIDNLDKNNLEEVKKFFINFMGKFYDKTNLSVKVWKKIKPILEKTDKITADYYIKLLKQAKEDFEKNKEIGYIDFNNQTKAITYKPTSKIKTKNPLFKRDASGN